MNFTKTSSIHHKISLALWDQSSPTAYGRLFCGTQKMHISDYVCKTCLTELGILLQCRETIEKVLATCYCSQNSGLPQFFLTKTKKCLCCWLSLIQN